MHIFSLIKVDKGRLPFYYGVGGRIKLREGDRDDNVGIRVPFGLAYLFENSRFELFFELVPILDLAPSTDVEFNGAVGFRYRF